MKHKYFENLHDDVDEPVFEGVIDFAFEYDSSMTLDVIRKLILEELNIYKTENNEKLI